MKTAKSKRGEFKAVAGLDCKLICRNIRTRSALFMVLRKFNPSTAPNQFNSESL